MTTLRDLSIGEVCKIQRVIGDGELKRRIVAMGLTRGTTVRVTNVAPLGDPLELQVRGYQLSVRKDDAARIEVTL
ncbi:MAG: ferrous iron transport protein A [Thermomicrobiales bacterium]|nr:ferrous iron transport protein A [Thermomicrobiales bacterium]MCO5229311.1 ferrous iron transport protein A [Thermomicrobiales bacterium]